jgi:prolyl oligopeptidase PreP (S9A serine peptidase family)
LLSACGNKSIISVKKHLLAIVSLFLCAGLTHAQPQARGATTGTPHGPDFAGATGKLFTDNPSFSATLEMLTTNNSPGAALAIFSGNIAVSNGKSRFEIDMTKTAGARMNPQHAANLKAMGLGTVILISRPDLKLSDLLYPGFNAYVETPASAAAAATTGTSKVETTELGRETVDGHPCVKNKVVVTDDKGVQHESTVWNATDLKNFPVKIEQNENGTVTTMTFTDVKLGAVGTEQFNVPAGATKYDNVSTLMQTEIMKRANVIRGTQ